MSFEITSAFVQQYGNNIYTLAQQKGSRLRPYVRFESIKGKAKFFDRIGSVEAQEATGRHEDTKYQDTPHSRRRLTTRDFRQADLIDDEDMLRTLIDPQNAYAQAQWWAMGRAMDKTILKALRGLAYSGEEGVTAVALPNSQKMISSTEQAPGTPVALNVDTLRALKRKFDSNDIPEELPRYLAVTSNQIYSLLGQTQVTSSDYAAVKALAQGEIDSFMGFKFIRTELLEKEDGNYDGTSGAVLSSGGVVLPNARRCLAWVQDGVILGVAKDMESKIDKLPNKNYATQVFSRMSIGATRMEEVKVVELLCKE